MQITKTYLKQLIREVLEEQNNDSDHTEEEQAYLDGLSQDYLAIAKDIINLFREIGGWFKSLTDPGGPLEGSKTTDYPILRKAEAIQLKLIDSNGNFRHPIQLARVHKGSAESPYQGSISEYSMYTALHQMQDEFKKIKEKADRIHDPEAGTKRDHAMRQSRGEISKFEKAAAQGFPKQDPEKQRGR